MAPIKPELISFVPPQLRSADFTNDQPFIQPYSGPVIIFDLGGSSSIANRQGGVRAIFQGMTERQTALQPILNQAGMIVQLNAGDSSTYSLNPGWANVNSEEAGIAALYTAREMEKILNQDPRLFFGVGVAFMGEIDKHAISIGTSNLAYAFIGPGLKVVIETEANRKPGYVMVSQGTAEHPHLKEFIIPVVGKNGPGFAIKPGVELPKIPNPPPPPTPTPDILARAKAQLPHDITENPLENRPVSALFAAFNHHAFTTPHYPYVDAKYVAEVMDQAKNIAVHNGATLTIVPTGEGAIEFLFLFGTQTPHNPYSAVEAGMNLISTYGTDISIGIDTGPVFVGNIGPAVQEEESPYIAFRQRNGLGNPLNNAARLVAVAEQGTAIIADRTRDQLTATNAVVVSSRIERIPGKGWERMVHQVEKLLPKTPDRIIATGREDKVAAIAERITTHQAGIIEVSGRSGSGASAIPLFAFKDASSDTQYQSWLETNRLEPPQAISYTLPILSKGIRGFALRHTLTKDKIGYKIPRDIDDPIAIERDLKEAIRQLRFPIVVIVNEAQRIDPDSLEILHRLASDGNLNLSVVLVRNTDEDGIGSVSPNIRYQVDYLRTTDEVLGFLQAYLASRSVTNFDPQLFAAFAQQVINQNVDQESLYESCQLATQQADPADQRQWFSEVQNIHVEGVGQAWFDSLHFRAQKALVTICAALAGEHNSTIPLDAVIQTLRYLTATTGLYGGISFSQRRDVRHLTEKGYILLGQSNGSRMASIATALFRQRSDTLDDKDRITILQGYLDRPRSAGREATDKSLEELIAESNYAYRITEIIEAVPPDAEGDWQITQKEARQAYAAAGEAVTAALSRSEFAVAATQYGYLIHIRSDYESLLPSEIVAKKTLADLYFEQGQAYHNAGMVTEAVAAINQSLRISEQAHGPDNQQRSIGALVDRGTKINAMVMVAKGKEFKQERLLALSRLATIVTHLQKKLFHKEPIKLTARNFGNYERLWTLTSTLRGLSLKASIPVDKLRSVNENSERITTVVLQAMKKPRTYRNDFSRAEFHNVAGIEKQNISNFHWRSAKELPQGKDRNQALKKAKKAMREGFKLSQPKTRSHAWLTYMHGLLYSIEGNHERAEELFNIALQEFSELKNISDIIDVISEGADEKPPLTVKVDNPYIQKALDRIKSAA